MERRGYIILALFLLVPILTYVFYPSEKKRITKVMVSGREAITGEDIDQLMEHISVNYRDDYGGTYLYLKKRMELIFNRYDDFDCTADITNISIEEERAQADMKISVLASEGRNRGYLIGDGGSAETIKVFLEKSPYKWKIIKIEKGIEK